MKKKLKLLDRILLLNLLPEEGNLKTLIIVKDIRTKIVITQEEINKYKLEVNGGQITWDNKAGMETFEYKFTELERNEIKLALEQADKNKKLREDHIEVCKIFGVLPA